MPGSRWRHPDAASVPALRACRATTAGAAVPARRWVRGGQHRLARWCLSRVLRAHPLRGADRRLPARPGATLSGGAGRLRRCLGVAGTQRARVGAGCQPGGRRRRQCRRDPGQRAGDRRRPPGWACPATAAIALLSSGRCLEELGVAYAVRRGLPAGKRHPGVVLRSLCAPGRGPLELAFLAAAGHRLAGRGAGIHRPGRLRSTAR
ncbi:hypothetical protein D3C76_1304450 [compost metagenome]